MNIGSLEPVSNRETWTRSAEVFESAPGDIDITGAAITVGLRDQKTKSVMHNLTVGDGVTITSGTGGAFEWTLTETQMRSICPGTYDLGIVVEISDTYTQLFAGTVPVVDGVIS